MKAILIIDMPLSCWECPCNYDTLECRANPGHKPSLFEERTKECPLRLMPEYVEITEEDDIYMKHYKQGINDTIDRLNGRLFQIHSGD